MKLQLNGETLESPVENLAALLVEHGYGDAVVATAINGNFVPACDRESAVLNNGDMIEVLAPMQGG